MDMTYYYSSNKVCTLWLLFVAFELQFSETEGTDNVNVHLSMGAEMLAQGDLQSALKHYHVAVDKDPKNYLTFFKRGTVYFALGKASLAISDFNKVLELKPDFPGARYQRAQILLKQGRLDEAKDDFYRVYESEGNEDAYHNVVRVEDLKSILLNAESFYNLGQYETAVDLMSDILDVCPWATYVRELRSQSYLALNDAMSAVSDLRSATKLIPDNTDGYFKLSLLYYQLGQPQESLREVRECLKLDPEHKDCFPHYKKVKKLVKNLDDLEIAIENKNYDTCAENAEKMLKVENKIKNIVFIAKQKLCHCYLHADKLSLAIKSCTEALEIIKSTDVLCDRAEAHVNNEMYDEALKDYHEVLSLYEDNQRAKEGIQRVQKLQKQSEKRDYYKILSVKRTATKQEITKAYRKAAQKWHPDNFPDGEEKKKAEKKFIDIAAAKEVLTDPEKRKKFDRGEDPLDPESGQHQGFNPFQQFHQFHSGGPFTFKFHFN